MPVAKKDPDTRKLEQAERLLSDIVAEARAINRHYAAEIHERALVSLRELNQLRAKAAQTLASR